MAGSRQPGARVWAPLLSMWLLYIAMHLLNQLLAPFGIWLFIEGLFLVFPLLYLRLKHGLLCILLLGLLLDAGSAYPLGLRSTAYALTLLAFTPLRRRVRRENKLQATLVALGLNLCVFLFVFCGVIASQPQMSWPLAGRALSDLLLSEAIVALAAMQWIHFQRQLLIAIANDDLGAQQL